MFNNFIKDLGLDKNDKKYIIAILVGTILFTVYLIWFNNTVGSVNSDVFAILNNALYYAGNLDPTNNIYLSPTISLLTAIFFKLGFVDKVPILIVTGIFYILGSIGLYFLFRSRFNKPLSLLGVILWCTFAINIDYVADGTLNIPEIALLIWSFLFLHLAVEKNPKYFVLSFPIFILAFFTRYPCILFLVVICLYLTFKYDLIGYIRLLFTNRQGFVEKFKNLISSPDFKYMIYGLVVSIVLAVIFLAIIMSAGANLYFLQQTSNAASGNTGNTADSHYNGSQLFYAKQSLHLFYTNGEVDGRPKLLSNPSTLSIFWLLIVALGLFLYVYRLCRENAKKFFTRVHEHKTQLLLIAGIVIVSILLVIGLFKISPVLSISLYIVDILLCYALLDDYITDINFKFIMLSWFIVFMIFYSFISIKVVRYMIVLTPIFAYFMISGVKIILSYIQKGLKKIGHFKPQVCTIIIVILAVSCIFSTFMLFNSFDVHEIPDNSKLTSNWLKCYDPNYDTKVIVSYTTRFHTWYLKKKVVGLNFKTLNEKNVTYYISDEPPSYSKHPKNYILIKRIGSEFIYKRISS